MEHKKLINMVYWDTYQTTTPSLDQILIPDLKSAWKNPSDSLFPRFHVKKCYVIAPLYIRDVWSTFTLNAVFIQMLSWLHYRSITNQILIRLISIVKNKVLAGPIPNLHGYIDMLCTRWSVPQNCMYHNLWYNEKSSISSLLLTNMK